MLVHRGLAEQMTEEQVSKHVRALRTAVDVAAPSISPRTRWIAEYQSQTASTAHLAVARKVGVSRRGYKAWFGKDSSQAPLTEHGLPH